MSHIQNVQPARCQKPGMHGRRRPHGSLLRLLPLSLRCYGLENWWWFNHGSMLCFPTISAYVCTIYIYVCVYTYVYVWTCIYVYIYIYICVCVCVCYVIVYVLIYVYLFSKTAKRKTHPDSTEDSIPDSTLHVFKFVHFSASFPSVSFKNTLCSQFVFSCFVSESSDLCDVYIYIVSVRVVYVMDMVNTKYIIHYSFITPSYIYHLNHLP